MTHGFFIKNFAKNLYVFFLLITYKSYSSTKIWKGSRTFFAFCDGFAKSSARDEKWIQCTECLLRAHVEYSDAETHMYVCEYCK